jgi:hypothetical protein
MWGDDLKTYNNAFSEVYEIINHLDVYEYNKIPSELIKVIRENRNLSYEYQVYDDIELKEHKLLPETKAILFNIFRDYLCTPLQKEKIIKIQSQERKHTEELKRKKYIETKKSKINSLDIDKKQN